MYERVSQTGTLGENCLVHPPLLANLADAVAEREERFSACPLERGYADRGLALLLWRSHPCGGCASVHAERAALWRARPRLHGQRMETACLAFRVCLLD